MLKKIFVICGVLFLTACSNSNLTTSKAIYPSNDERNDDQLTALIGNLKTNKPIAAHITDKNLAKVYNKWVGTRYRFGGTTQTGIDCSAFMQEAFQAAYGINLPRTTSEQRYVGKQIQKHELKKGDLVFFRKNRHVGIYLGNNQFMHSSTSSGVTISSLDENYWSRTYSQSRRVL